MRYYNHREMIVIVLIKLIPRIMSLNNITHNNDDYLFNVYQILTYKSMN